jgi:hypothetical protein
MPISHLGFRGAGAFLATLVAIWPTAAAAQEDSDHDREPSAASRPAVAAPPTSVAPAAAARPAASPPPTVVSPAASPPSSITGAAPRRKWAQLLLSFEAGPSAPLLSASRTLGTGLEVDTHVGIQFHSLPWLSLGPEARVSYCHFWNRGTYLGYPTPGATGMLTGTLGLRVTAYVGRFEIWGAARVGGARVWRRVEGFSRLDGDGAGVVYDLEVGAAIAVAPWLGLGLTLSLIQPYVGESLGRTEFNLLGLSLGGTFLFRP